MEEFPSLTQALKDWFDKPFAELPCELRKRIEHDFSIPWGRMDADQRRSAARQWDDQNAPAIEHERENLFKLVREQLEVEAMPATNPLERESKIRQLESIEKEIKQIDDKIKDRTDSRVVPRLFVSSNTIMAKFPRHTCIDKNFQWWNRRMRRASDYGLESSRASKGRGSTPSYWYPDMIAAWLVDKKHISSSAVVQILRNEFPKCEACQTAAEWLDRPQG